MVPTESDSAHPATPDDVTILGDSLATRIERATPEEHIAATRNSPPVAGENPGDQIGPFTLITKIGEGGFGSVWLAERREPYIQRVALKVIKAGMDSKAVLGRFEQERQALAVMNHANIARVLDGGISVSGRPYFAMEHVKGGSITEYCDDRKLTLEDRLHIFVQVCAAIQHAHSKGIIHRDLKPGNVLVATGDNDVPIAKVIDFGVAKALDARMSSENIVYTQVGVMIGTPEYMSPEQADPDANDIDIRADVFSLGVILYELLVGVLPFEAKDLRTKTFSEMQRMIREEDPPRPSARLSTLAMKDPAMASRISTSRRLGYDAITKTLKTELEWIPLKAMRKEREERYATAQDFGRDVSNYLAGLPLLAAPESAAYRTRKFVRRHRASVATAVIVTVVLIASSIISTLFGFAEARARARAEQREREVQKVLEFQQSQLLGIGQEEAGLAMSSEIIRQFTNSLSRSELSQEARDAALRQFKEAILRVNHTDVAYQLIRGAVLTKGIAIAEADYGADPFVQAGLLMTIGRIYYELGDGDESARLFRRAQEIYQGALGSDDRRTLSARDWASRAGLNTLESKKALEESKEVLEIRRTLFGPGDADTLESMRALCEFEAASGRNAEAAVILNEVITVSRTGPHNVQNLIGDMTRLGALHRLQGLVDESEKGLLEARRLVDGIQPTPQRLRASVLTGLGLTQTNMHDPAKVAAGVEALRTALAIDEAVNGEQHRDSFVSRNNLGVMLERLGATDAVKAAESMQVLERSQTIGGSLPLAPNAYYIGLVDLAVGNVKHPVADPQQRKVQLRDALQLADDALRALSVRDDPTSDLVLRTRNGVASIHIQAGDPAGGERMLNEILAVRLSYLTPGDKLVLNVKSDIAHAQALQGRWSDAVETLTAAQVDAIKERPAETDARWKTSTRLLSYLQQWSKVDEASPAASRIAAQELVVEGLKLARQKVKRDIALSDFTVAP